MAALKEKQKYFQELLAIKFNKEDRTKIGKYWDRTNEEFRQDFIHVQKLYDGMVVYKDRYVDTKIQ